MSIPIKPTVFPTEQLLIAAILAFASYLIVTAFYSSIRKDRAYLNNGAKDKTDVKLVVWLLIAAFALRVVISNYVVGHKTDINCFTSWGYRAATSGFANFYASGFSDYPPGYIYILSFMSRISTLLGHGIKAADGSYDLVCVFLNKLPSIIADLGSAYLVYRLARKKLRFEPSFLLMALVAFNPVLLYVSSGWGQIDQLLTVLLACSILLLMSNKPIWAGIVYGLSILMKPQALMAGPLLAIAYFMYVFDGKFFELTDVKSEDSLSKRLIKTVIAVACACLMIVITAMPFSTKDMPWYEIIVEKYLGTATSYNYASVNAYNIYALFGANWKSIDSIAFADISYGTIGTIGMIFSVGFSAVLYILGRKKHRGALTLSTAYLFAALFTLGHYMHERYIIPTLLLLVIAYLLYSDRRLLYLMVAYTFPILLNCFCSFYYSKFFEYGLYWDKALVFWCSLINVLMFAYFTYLVVRIMILGRVKGDVFPPELVETMQGGKVIAAGAGKSDPKLKRMDMIEDEKAGSNRTNKNENQKFQKNAMEGAKD